LKFEEFGLSPDLMTGLDAMGFENATPVQEKAIPAILQGEDLLACAQTGTGKTAAFLLPILHRIHENPNDGIDTIILEPTRELAVQVDQQLEGFSYFTGVSSIAIYGGRDGHSMDQEMKALKQGADIIVATPGRLLAHLQLGYVKLNTVRHFVLDEADRMLDMGFVTDIMTIVNKLPRERQTLLFSATMPEEIRRFSKGILRKPVEISIAISKPAEGILQGVYMVEDAKKNKLIEILLRNQKDKNPRVLVFAGTKRSVKDLSSHLRKKGFNAAEIHSDLEQKDREETLVKFRSGGIPILVATDVMSRGIDIKGIEVVINFDVPGDPEDYVHRIGRTARADATGVALTLVSKMGRRKFDRIERLMGIKVQQLPLPPELESSDSPRPKTNRPQGQAPQPNPEGNDNNRSRRRKRGGRNRRRGRGGTNNPGGPPSLGDGE
jgi:superfamily II DNA/RNA helicase